MHPRSTRKLLVYIISEKLLIKYASLNNNYGMYICMFMCVCIHMHECVVLYISMSLRRCVYICM